MRLAIIGCGLATAMLVPGMAAGATKTFTEDFPIDDCTFKPSGGNAFFNLTPGRQAYFSNQRCVAAGDCDELEELWITVTGQTRWVTLRDDGEVDIYEDGEIVSHDGAWLAGRHGAEPGIIMPDPAFLIGSRYYQEIAPDIALDRAEHVALDLEIDVPAGFFEDCVQVNETTPLEPGSVSTKIYCPGPGLVRDGDLELIAIFNNATPPTAD